jgi:hypothetical protein
MTVMFQNIIRARVVIAKTPNTASSALLLGLVMAGLVLFRRALLASALHQREHKKVLFSSAKILGAVVFFHTTTHVGAAHGGREMGQLHNSSFQSRLPEQSRVRRDNCRFS